MKKAIVSAVLLIVCTLTAEAQSNRWGVGLRVGDPLGLTVKWYLPGGKAWELNLGQSGFYGYNYRRTFDRYDDFNDYGY